MINRTTITYMKFIDSESKAMGTPNRTNLSAARQLELEPDSFSRRASNQRNPFWLKADLDEQRK